MDSKPLSVVNGISPEESKRIIDRHREDGWVDLDPLKKAFAINFAHSSSVSEASEAIGKPLNFGMRYYQDPLVRALIHDLQEEISKVCLINRSLVEQKMIETLEKLEGKQSIPIITGQGIPMEEKKFHSSEVVSLLKEMSRIANLTPSGSSPGGPAGGVNIQINMGSLLSGEPDGVVVDG